MEFPSAVQDLVARLWVEQSSPAYLVVDATGSIVEIGGQVERYGLDATLIGSSALESIDVLSMSLPFQEPHFVFHRVRVTESVFADVHIVSSTTTSWIVFVDCTEHVERHRILQQLSNDMELFRQSHARMLEATTDGPDDPMGRSAEFDPRGACRDVSIVLARVDLTDALTNGSPREALDLADLVCRGMKRSLVDDGAIVQRIDAETVRGIFGVLRLDGRHEERAVMAAVRLFETLPNLTDETVSTGHLPAVCVTTGQAALRLLDDANTERLSILGAPLTSSARMIGTTEVGEIRIDAATFEAIENANPEGLVFVTHPDGTRSTRRTS